MKRLLATLVLVIIPACGSDSPPAAPTPVLASVAGSWSGTAQYTAFGAAAIQSLLMDLTQAGSSVNGTYAAQTFTGTVTGATTTGTFSGTFTFNGHTATGTACTGTFAVSGSAGGATLNWTSPGVTATCSGTPINMTLAVQRR